MAVQAIGFGSAAGFGDDRPSTSPAALAAATWRLTGRGWLLVLLAAVLAAPLLLAALRGPTPVGADSSVPVAAGSGAAAEVPGALLAAQGLTRPYVAGPGDTLWALATGLVGAGDPRPMVDELQRLNGLEDSIIAVGRTLWLPVADAPGAGDDGATVG